MAYTGKKPKFEELTVAGYLLPVADGTANQIIKTDGSGVLSFVDAGGSGTVTSIGITGSGNLTITNSPITTSGNIDIQMVETDPVFTASEAFNITSGDIANLANLSGTNSGDQTITLTGGVTGSGTGSFTATVVTNANLTGPITSVGNATSIASKTGTGTTFAMSASPTFTGTVTVPDPVNATDAANKGYVDSIKQALDIKDSVRVASTANVDISSELVNGASIDGVTVATGDRVLLKNQTTASENGIYVVVASGVASRSSDANTSDEVNSGMYTFVSEGIDNASTGFVLTTPDPITLDSTSLSFTAFSGAGQVIAGNGLSKSGNTLSINTAITVDVSTAQTLSNKTFVSPDLGEPSAGIATNLTGTAAGLTAGNVTTNADLTGPITSVGNATSVASQTGTGSTFVMNTSPTLVTPSLGVAVAQSINKVDITEVDTGATLTIDDGMTLHVTGNVTALSGSHTGTSSGSNTGDQDLSDYFNKTTDSTTDITVGANFNFVTDAELAVLQNTSGTNTGDQTSVSGNAGTATALQTARNINGVAFDGTADITVTAAAGTLTGSTLNSSVTASSLTSVGSLNGLTVAGPIRTALSTKTANYTITSTDSIILVDSTSGVVTITLPTAVGIAGRQYFIKDKTGQSVTNTITITGDGSETIDGAATQSIDSEYESMAVVSDGANWSVL